MTGAPSTVDARGPAAGIIADLWWFMLAVGAVIFVITAAYLFVATVRQPSERGPRALVGGGSPFIALWGIVVPALVLTTLMMLNFVVGERTHGPPSEPELLVQVTGHEFWWEIRYPEHDVLTANEIVIPVGEPVGLELEAVDVIHAFWVPQLHGKMDMVPGHTNTFWIQADEPGEYRGICAEYCGIQHAQMHFVLLALERDEFDAWVAARQGPPTEPEAGTTAAEGLEVFVSANCIACHGVEGVSPETQAAPDLTDFAARRSLAAGMQPNTRENRRGWILDPHAFKRGVRMPPTPLPEDELEALLDYLETLRPDAEQGADGT